METFINILNDLIIIVGNLVIFSLMLNFKELKVLNKIIICVSSVLFMVAYTLCVYLWGVPYVHATLFCFTIPSVIIFWICSNVKDSRFFLSFCIVDTISFIIGFTTKYSSFFYENIAPYITFVINIIVYSLIIGLGYKSFKKYAELMKFKKAGWLVMMIASFIIYFALYFLAAFPTPIKERTEYGPAYFVFCAVILSCYVVFFDSMIKTKKIHDQYTELESERKYHKIAYIDSLTGLYNRFYFIEKMNEIERNRTKYKNLCCIVSDINDFKSINDKFGHQVGDDVLQDTAKYFVEVFYDVNAYIFRTGGDEFYTMLIDVDENIIDEKINMLSVVVTDNSKIGGKIVSVSSGYSLMNDTNVNSKLSIEENFNIADKNMYNNKNKYKENHPEIQPVID